MKILKTLILAAAVAAAFTTGASADPRTPGIDRRETRQHSRIREGVRHGQLTRAEEMRLRHGQRHIRRMEHRAKRDGMMTRRERCRVHRALDAQDRAIYRLKHNARERQG